MRSGRLVKDRLGLWITGIATATGLWMGLVAPSVSPVTPPPGPTTPSMIAGTNGP
jgi:hypothetical protein